MFLVISVGQQCIEYIFIISMGNKACNICEQSVHNSQIIYAYASLRQDQYRKSTFPHDQCFSEWVENRKWDMTEADVYLRINNPTQYFIGNWKDQVPVGKCIIYQPELALLDATFINGIPTGKAEVCFISQCCTYKGMLNNGYMEGHGKFIDHKQNFSFQGVWKASVAQSGKLFLRNDKFISWIMFDKFQEGLGRIQYKDGKFYQGKIDLNSFTPHGYGKTTYSSTSSKAYYQGEWNQGKFHNHGTCQFKNGDKYIGSYKLGKKEGKGRFVFSSGKVYEGEWLDGKQNGKGVLYSKNGQIIYDGLWKQGQFAKDQNQNDITAVTERSQTAKNMKNRITSRNTKEIFNVRDSRIQKGSQVQKISVCASLQKARKQFNEILGPLSPMRKNNLKKHQSHHSIKI